MTWIVAKKIFPEYVAVLSDVQVTWRDGKVQKDCLKKVYPISDNVIAGFSGSVDTGFLLLTDLNAYMVGVKKNREPLIPRKIALQWYRRARKIFKNLPNTQRKMGCSILLAGISPTELSGNTDIPRTDIIVFKHNNNFKPRFISSFDTVSIGSGNNVKAYKEFLDGTNDLENYANILRAESTFGGAGEQLAFLLSIMLQKNKVAGVSQHIHCSLVSRFGWKQFPLNFNTYDKNDIKTRIIMPKVAESYTDYKIFEKTVNSIKGAGHA
ncbi:MAG TPA: hypothetical protein ENJ28_12145 [Gammaproteobacteria bacterium]|nr:hypothetical protein [Gammaproteobacteria bacterium]